MSAVLEAVSLTKNYGTKRALNGLNFSLEGGKIVCLLGSNGSGKTTFLKIAAGILGILLGCFGVHNFYLGYTGKAIAQLCLSLLSCGVLSFASAIWGLVEGIMILTGSINTDANGIPLQD